MKPVMKLGDFSVLVSFVNFSYAHFHVEENQKKFMHSCYKNSRLTLILIHVIILKDVLLDSESLNDFPKMVLSGI